MQMSDRSMLSGVVAVMFSGRKQSLSSVLQAVTGKLSCLNDQGLLKKISMFRVVLLGEMLLIIVLASQLASMTWVLVDQDKKNVRWQSSASVKSSVQSSTEVYPHLNDLFLFGEPVIEQNIISEVADISSIPRSRLQTRITGIVSHPDEKQSLAIIVNGGDEKSYWINDKIARTNATIVMIYPDRVIVENQGKQEALLLYPNEPHKVIAPSSRKEVVSVTTVHEQVLENPQSLMELVSISPVRDNGQLKGYRVNPKQNPELFKSLGLVANDLTIAINGFDLTDTQEAMQAFRGLPEARQIVLTIEREGQLQDIEILL